MPELPESLDVLFSGSSEPDDSAVEQELKHEPGDLPAPPRDEPAGEPEGGPLPKTGASAGRQGAAQANPDLDKIIRQRDAIIAERRNLAARLREEQEARKRLEDKLGAAPQPAKVEEEKEPDPKVDPLGYLEFKRRKEMEELNKKIEEVSTGFAQKAQELEQREKLRVLLNHVDNDERAFREKNPDYDQAVNFLDNRVFEWFVSQGVSEQEAVIGLDEFKRQLFLDAMNLNLSVADVFYQHAVKAGHKKVAKERVDPRVTAAKRGVEAGSSLSNVSRGGSQTRGNGEVLTIERYQALPDFDPLKLEVAMDSRLFRTLIEEGEVRVP